MKKIILIATCLLNLTLLSAQGIEFVENMTFEEIQAKAKAEGKLIFMDCYTTWCGPCKMLTSRTFPDPEVGNYFNPRFINVKMDMEKGEGPSLQAKFGVRAYPTLLWIDGEGTVKHRAMGFMDAQGLINQAMTIPNLVPSAYEGLKAKYEKGERSADFMQEYVSVLKEGNMDYEAVFAEYIKLLSPNDLKDGKHTQTIYQLTNDLKSAGLPQLMKNKAFYVTKYGASNIETKLNGIADKALKEAVVKKDENLIKGASKLMKDAGLKDQATKTAKAYSEFYLRTQNWKMYDKYASELVKKSGAKDDKILNSAAWNYYMNVEDNKLLNKAKGWAYKAVNLKNTCENNTTYAYLNYKLGNLKEAELACDYALLKADEDGANPSSARALKDLIKKEREKK